MFTMWRDVVYFLVGALVGAFIAVAEFGPALRECATQLSNPEHCISYCEKAWADYGC